MVVVDGIEIGHSASLYIDRIFASRLSPANETMSLIYCTATPTNQQNVLKWVQQLPPGYTHCLWRLNNTATTDIFANFQFISCTNLIFSSTHFPESHTPEIFTKKSCFIGLRELGNYSLWTNKVNFAKSSRAIAKSDVEPRKTERRLSARIIQSLVYSGRHLIRSTLDFLRAFRDFLLFCYYFDILERIFRVIEKYMVFWNNLQR